MSDTLSSACSGTVHSEESGLDLSFKPPRDLPVQHVWHRHDFFVVSLIVKNWLSGTPEHFPA